MKIHSSALNITLGLLYISYIFEGLETCMFNFHVCKIKFYFADSKVSLHTLIFVILSKKNTCKKLFTLNYKTYTNNNILQVVMLTSPINNTCIKYHNLSENVIHIIDSYAIFIFKLMSPKSDFQWALRTSGLTIITSNYICL